MLQQILHEMKQYDMPLSVTMLSRQLEIEPSALEGMLETLVRKGRVVELCNDSPADHCRDCPIKSACATGSKLYLLAEGK
jgi:hypothetical protein